ncbi:MAG: HpaII family restriction endonuclease [Candidatus Nanoarchaeia archaeon]|nr:HpaII family restriction endonuclease [Candidatus Nanoarchaeia archaeon]
MTIKGNKGEWTEIYVLLKLLADGKLYAGDENLGIISDIYSKVLRIDRKEKEGEYHYLRNDKISILDSNGKVLVELDATVFNENAKKLLKEIKEAKGPSFSVSDVEEFMHIIKCKSLKAKSTQKSDITIQISEPSNPLKVTLKFSIKSQLGRASTLLNPGKTTNFVYKIDAKSINKDELKSIDLQTNLKNKIKSLEIKGYNLIYDHIESENFHSNLRLIESTLPEMVAAALVKFYGGKFKTLKELTDELERINPLGYSKSGGQKPYEHKMKQLLYAAALGMTPGKIWEGEFEALGGYILVNKKGEVLGYTTHNQNKFMDYLLNNTKFEIASRSRYKFGKIYSENGQYYTKLNLQIRFL